MPLSFIFPPKMSRVHFLRRLLQALHDELATLRLDLDRVGIVIRPVKDGVSKTILDLALE